MQRVDVAAAAAHEDRPHDAGAAGMRPARPAGDPAGRGALPGAATDPEAPAERQGALLRPQVRRGAAAWQRCWPGRGGAEAATAAYWIARCSESLGEDERAFKEYGRLPGPAARRPRPGRGGPHQPRRPGRPARQGGDQAAPRRPARGPRRPEQDRALLRGPPALHAGARAGHAAVPVLQQIVRGRERRRPRGARQAGAAEAATPGPVPDAAGRGRPRARPGEDALAQGPRSTRRAVGRPRSW